MKEYHDQIKKNCSEKQGKKIKQSHQEYYRERAPYFATSTNLSSRIIWNIHGCFRLFDRRRFAGTSCFTRRLSFLASWLRRCYFRLPHSILLQSDLQKLDNFLLQHEKPDKISRRNRHLQKLQCSVSNVP